MSALTDAAKVIRDAFSYDPGHSDLDDEQPIVIHCSLGDWRRLNRALYEAAGLVQPEDRNTELRVLKEVSDELSLHGHGLAAARVERRIHRLQEAV